VRQSLRLVAIGGAVGIGASLLLTRSLRALLFGVDPMDWRSLVVAIAAVVVIAVAAALKPAWRSTRIDPAGVLKSS
jgi:ABC-type antimicrobial peptide transport system permease subunit